VAAPSSFQTVRDRRDLAQGLSAQRLPFRRQSATLIVGETHASPARLQLFFEDSILFDQVGDNSRLPASDPSSKRRQQELEMNRFNHPTIVSEAGN
jgi:hypothetical protein